MIRRSPLPKEGVSELPLTTPSASAAAAPYKRSYLCKKIFILLVRDVNQTSSSRNIFLDYIKDIAIGTLFGLFFLLFVSILPRRKSSSRQRSVAYELLLDPEWTKTIEENNDVKFVDLDIYNAMQKEIRHEGGFGSMSKHTANYEENSKKLESNRQQLEEGVKERDELKQELESSLSNWCGHCKSGFGNCDARLTFLQDRYGTNGYKGRIDIMKEGKCILPGKTFGKHTA